MKGNFPLEVQRGTWPDPGQLGGDGNWGPQKVTPVPGEIKCVALADLLEWRKEDKWIVVKANFQKNVKIQHTTLERYLGGKRFGVVQLCQVVCFDRFMHILGLDEFLCTNDILNSGSRGGREKANRRMKNKKCPSADHVWPEVRFGLN